MARPLRRPSPRRRRSSASGSRPPRPGRRCPRSSRSASLTSRASRTLLAFLVAVDVGHYYGEPGVISASGRAEFEYNLELASQLKGLLNEAGLKVRMIGERGDYAILHYRTRDAAGADLFLSIHHDSVRLSQLPHAHRFAGFSLFVSRRNPQADKSLACASAIGARLRAAGFTPSRYHADPVLGENRPFADEINGVHYYDNLTVARSAAMPAVLVEDAGGRQGDRAARGASQAPAAGAPRASRAQGPRPRRAPAPAAGLPAARLRARPARSQRRGGAQGRGLRGHGEGPQAPGSRRAMTSVRDLEHRVGEEIAVSPWVEITQERIDTSARAVEDFQWIHVDRSRALSSPFGGTIAHGFLTLSLLSHLSEMTFSFSDRRMGVNYGLNRVRFTSPVPSGSRVRARFTLSKYEKLDGNGVQVTWNAVIEREGSAKPALVAEWIGRHYY